MSDEEAFASAEEGEEGAKNVTDKPSKGAQAASKEKGGAKQKGKQQQQQRKKKGKGQTAEEKDKPVQKKPAEKSSSATKSSAAVKSEDAATRRTEASPASDVSKDSQASVSSSSESVVESSSKDSVESTGVGKDSESVSVKSTPKETASDKNVSQPESESSVKEKSTSPVKEKPETPAENKTQTPAKEKSKSPVKEKPETPAREKSESPAQTAGDIRQKLSQSTTGDGSVRSPGEQGIPRQVEGPGTEPGEEPQAEGGEGEGEWGWGWGSSILNAATNSLETFSSQVGEGLNTIMDTVESSLGVPTPEDLMRTDSAADLAKEPAEATDKETVTAQPNEKEASKETPVSTDATGAKKEGAEKGEQVEEKKEEESKEEGGGGGWLSGWGMSSIGNMGKSLVNKSQNLMNTGFEKAETLAAGGLDILETIGKKTYSTLTEHDPGLRRAREFLHHPGEKPSLSSVLKEAQEKAEEQVKRDEESEEARKVNFTALFEDNQGLAHLEALEMLSNRSERKVQSLLSAMEEEMVETIRPQLMEIKDTFQQSCDAAEKEQESSEHDFSKLVTENLSELHLGTAPDKLNKVQENVRQWIADFYSHEDHNEISDAKEVQQRAVQSLADVTSKAVEQFHKAGELVLMQKDEEKSYTHRAQSLAKLSSVLGTEVDILANKFSQCLIKIGEEKKTTEEVNPMVTCVYLEASNASGYIQDAFQLLLPVLQHAAIQSVLADTL